MIDMTGYIKKRDLLLVPTSELKINEAFVHQQCLTSGFMTEARRVVHESLEGHLRWKSQQKII
jgi:hypothetical protein